MTDGMARKLLGGAQEALGAAAGVARHLVWYVTYHIDGRPREDQETGRLSNGT